MSITVRDLKTFLGLLTDEDAKVWIEDGDLCAVAQQCGSVRLDHALRVGGEHDETDAADHREADPHCTCPDCVDFHFGENTDFEDNRKGAADLHDHFAGTMTLGEASRIARGGPDAGIAAADRAFKRSRRVED